MSGETLSSYAQGFLKQRTEQFLRISDMISHADPDEYNLIFPFPEGFLELDRNGLIVLQVGIKRDIEKTLDNMFPKKKNVIAEVKSKPQVIYNAITARVASGISRLRFP